MWTVLDLVDPVNVSLTSEGTGGRHRADFMANLLNYTNELLIHFIKVTTAAAGLR